MLTSARHTTAKHPNLPFKRASFTMQKDCFWRVKAYLLAYKTYPFEKRNQVPYDQKWNSFTTRHTTYSLSHCETLARLLKCNHQEEISIINKGTCPNGQVPFTYIRVIITPQQQPVRRLTGADYQQLREVLGNIWETLWACTAHSAPDFLNKSSHFCHFDYFSIF